VAVNIDEEDVGGSGYSLADLSAYLDRDRTPAIAAIDTNAACQAVLDNLARLGSLSRDLVEEDSRGLPDAEPGWFDRLIAAVSVEARAGRDIPFSAGDPESELVITEGALRELVRRAGDTVPGVIVGRSRLSVDEELDARVSVSVSVVADRSLRALADEVRERVHAALRRHSPLRGIAVDVTVEDVRPGGVS
jgi:hypothetical protein